MELREIPEALFDEIENKPDFELEELGDTEFYESEFSDNFDLTLYVSENGTFYMRKINEWLKCTDNDKIDEILRRS